MKIVFLVLDQSNTFGSFPQLPHPPLLIISRVLFRLVLVSLRLEAGAPVSIAQVAGIPQLSFSRVIVESPKQWSEEELAWRPPWPGAVFEPKSQKHLTHTLLRQAPECVEKIDKEVDR